MMPVAAGLWVLVMVPRRALVPKALLSPPTPRPGRRYTLRATAAATTKICRSQGRVSQREEAPDLILNFGDRGCRAVVEGRLATMLLQHIVVTFARKQPWAGCVASIIELTCCVCHPLLQVAVPIAHERRKNEHPTKITDVSACLARFLRPKR